LNYESCYCFGNPKEAQFQRYENGAIYAYDNIAGDINGDGKPELFALSGQEGLFCYQITENPEKKWKQLLIGEGISGGIWPYGIADIDNDGDADVFSGGGPMTGDLSKRCFIWENKDSLGGEWIRHEILTDVECFDAVAGDVDGDGDIDICSKPWKGKTVYYLKNMLMERKK